MAWTDWTYSCGHEGREQMYGHYSSRDARVEYLEGRLCPDCFKKEAREIAAKQEKLYLDPLSKLSLSALRGTEKQVTWANGIRVQKLAALLDSSGGDVTKIIERIKVEDDFGKALRIFVYATNAAWWIDNRNESPKAILNLIVSKIQNEKIQLNPRSR
jgi:hypothetical protein